MIKIRQANLADPVDRRKVALGQLELQEPGLVRYGQTAFTPPADIAEYEEKLLTYLLQPCFGTMVLLAEDDGNVIGIFVTQRVMSSWALLPVVNGHDLFVRESHRKQGVATMLMDAFEAFAWEIGAARVSLETSGGNEVARAMYLKRGYLGSCMELRAGEVVDLLPAVLKDPQNGLQATIQMKKPRPQ